MHKRLVIDALKMAIDARQPEGDLIHHSDRGGQYTSDDFRDVLELHDIQCGKPKISGPVRLLGFSVVD